MPTNKLTDARIRGLQPAGALVKFFDGGGLYLAVTDTGSKLWRMAYRLDGKQKTISFGPYPEVGLAKAREMRDNVKRDLRAGVDPMATRKKTDTPSAGLTFTAAVYKYLDGRGDLSDKYKINIQHGLEMYLFPVLGKMDVGRIDRATLLAELQRINNAGKYSYVRKIRIWAGQVFDYAVENGWATVNPAGLIRPEKAFGRKKVEHMAALDLKDIPDLMQRLALEKDLNSVLACRLLALTWVRTGELRMMKWTEIDADLWRIPAGKMKRQRDHLVPLSRQALGILEQMEIRSRSRSEYVFPADHRFDRPMSENAVLYLLHRIGYKGKMTGHGWRSVASTWANEHGYAADAIERQLSHVPDDKIRSAYNRAEYLPVRKKMLQDWADWLESISR